MPEIHRPFIVEFRDGVAYCACGAASSTHPPRCRYSAIFVEPAVAFGSEKTGEST